MIKARVENIIVLGLSDENMKRLSQNDPILIHLSELEIPKELSIDEIKIVIFNGRTEDEMYIGFLPLIDLVKTKIHI